MANFFRQLTRLGWKAFQHLCSPAGSGGASGVFHSRTRRSRGTSRSIRLRLSWMRHPCVEHLESRELLAGVLHQVNAFHTWNATPQVIPSTDPAGITYYAPTRSLLIADSEIDENPQFNGFNMFQVARDGKSMARQFWPGQNIEPTGVTWNERDGFFYVSNDDEKTITRFDENLKTVLGTIDSRRLGVNDPEDITSDPAGNLYVVSGHPPLVSQFDSHFNLIRTFSTSLEMLDAEGIAFNRQNGNLLLVSSPDKKLFEYTPAGVFVQDYSLLGLQPAPQTPQGLTFAPCTDDPQLQCLFIADGGRDNTPDGHVYEVRIDTSGQRHYSVQFAEESYAFGPIPENAMPGRVVGRVSASDKNGEPLTYSILSGNQDGRFTVDPSSGLITTQNQLDFEDAAHYTLVVKAETRDRRMSSSVEVSIELADLLTEVAKPKTQSLSFQHGHLPTPGFAGTQDTKIRRDFPDSNYGSSTRLEFDGKPDMSALLKWDIRQLAPGTSVQSASLTINVVNTSLDVFNLYQLKRPWSESVATFNHFDTESPWQVSGASGPDDRGLRVLGTVTAPSLGSATVRLNRDGVAVIQNWVNHPTQNFGIAIQDFTDARTDDLVFSAKEAADPLLRPKLTIEYAHYDYSADFWRNPVNRWDTNGDTALTPADALVIINRLNGFGNIDLTDPSKNRPGSGYYPDVSGDGMITPFDVLFVINQLNELPEGEPGIEFIAARLFSGPIVEPAFSVDHASTPLEQRTTQLLKPSLPPPADRTALPTRALSFSAEDDTISTQKKSTSETDVLFADPLLTAEMLDELTGWAEVYPQLHSR